MVHRVLHKYKIISKPSGSNESQSIKPCEVLETSKVCWFPKRSLVSTSLQPAEPQPITQGVCIPACGFSFQEGRSLPGAIFLMRMWYLGKIEMSHQAQRHQDRLSPSDTLHQCETLCCENGRDRPPPLGDPTQGIRGYGISLSC